ncbi:translational inhibitor protein [Buchnera aphidicola str. Bp (Baizongia pistaciae)]|uniref:RutC family protein bbp_334 n=1 Tax=Buchnera aphidicola subsp. Baizongia pistaciae (strain Bp) TaxID=224915 RepID=Y334_BUCBP|nr:Rid family detoxifying hydrolase [Buchnera aphidicola]Q89AG0.1 RecName: Full=RutC family protein bbp_334 [Buchnera aphidicola str. Bp (Baizongia pistaciae)]AAO27055.1 translational inhibitor protein [Buchnera aphidicola str. Bp (Baizongia pistaciae)]
MIKEIHTHKSPKPIGPYSQAIQIKNFTFLSGQISQTDNINTNISFQTQSILQNINYILESKEMNVGNIVKTTIFITNLNDLTIVNDVYQKFFLKYTKTFPARSCVEVSKLPKNAKIEIDAIAYKNK